MTFAFSSAFIYVSSQPGYAVQPGEGGILAEQAGQHFIDGGGVEGGGPVGPRGSLPEQQPVRIHFPDSGVNLQFGVKYTCLRVWDQET